MKRLVLLYDKKLSIHSCLWRIHRNGLRPSRYYVTRDNVVVMASEVGVYDVDPVDIVHKVSVA